MRVHLPIDDYLDEITEILRKSQNLVVVAEPGAGKTTRLPPALLKMGFGRTLVLEPRRVAAIAAADRVAFETGLSLGAEIGYQVRFDSKTSASTQLTFMTEALLVRRLLSEPELNGVDVVVLDEFHERSAHIDIALGMLREMQVMGHPIKLIIMSATLNAESISEYLGGAPVVHVPGKLHPLQITHLKKSLGRKLDSTYFAELCKKIQSACENSEADTLVFLPGVREIERTREHLQSWSLKNNFELASLHGTLDLESQRRVLHRSESLHTQGARRIILSTNVAESSLTLDGVTTVIDTGFSKTMRHDLTTGFSRLELTRISLSSATQRSGRAARQAPGHCYRMWTPFDETTMAKNNIAEILRVDLSEYILTLAALGVRDFLNFTWYESPDKSQIKKAVQELQSLQALDSKNHITSLGRELTKLPVTPRLGHFLLLAQKYGHLKLASRLAALLQDRDILKKSEVSQYAHYENDLLARLEALAQFEKNGSGANIKVYVAKSVLNVAEQIYQLLANGLSNAKSSLTFEQVVILAFNQQICRRRDKSDRAKMVGGRGLKISPLSSVKTSEFFIALSVSDSESSSDSVVHLAFGIDRKALYNTLKENIFEHQDLYFDEEKGQIFSRKVEKLYDLELEEDRLSPASSEQSETQLCHFLVNNLELVKRKNPDLKSWLSRWDAFAGAAASAAAAPGAAASVPSAAFTAAAFKSAFEMACMGCRRIDDVLNKNLIPFFETQLPRETLLLFNREAPPAFCAPTGSNFKISYPSGRAPYIEIRLQEIFGIKENPKLLFGSTRLQFHLLGPNYRPVQVTSDIASFWKNTYPEVRKELRTRYPKHSWPEDPHTAAAVKKGQSAKR